VGVRAFRITVGVLFGLLLVAGLAAAALALGGAPALRWAIEHPLSRLAGHRISVDGGLTVRWGAPTRITAERLRIANAPWGSRPDMLAAEHVEIEFFPAGLVLGRRHVPLIAIDHALLSLERSREGEGNWGRLFSLAASGGHAGAPIVEHLVLRDSRLLFHDQASGAETDIVAGALDLQALGPREIMHLSARGSFQRVPLQLEGKAQPLPAAADGGGYAIDLDGVLGDSHIAARGTIDALAEPKRSDIELSAAGRNLQQIAGALGVPLPPLPDFRGEGRLSGGAGNWTLAIASLQLGHSDLAGNIAVDRRRSPPYLRAELSSSRLDSADFVGFLGVRPPASSAPGGEGKARPPLIVPATPAALGELLGIDADLTLSVNAKRFAATLGPPLEALSTAIRLRSGVLTVEHLAFGLAGGSAALALTYDTKRPLPALNLDVDLRKMDLGRFVRQTSLPAVFAESTGRAGGFVHLRSTGRSLRELLGRMDGEAAIFVADGQFDAALKRLAAPDVLQALGIDMAAGKPVPVACVVAQFELRNGVATARALMLDSEPSVLVGAGNFNFAAETIYLDLTPHHKHFSPTNLGAPIELRGTFADPQIGISKANILQRLGNWLDSDRVAPPPALMPLIDAGLGEGNACDRSFKATTPEAPLTGSSRTPANRR
jgi:uncharacterized protein involved in outer membrane biogenesis